MLPRIQGLLPGLCVVEAQGRVTRQDCEEVLIPLPDEARRGGDYVRFLYRFGPEFEEFTGGAAFEDARVGMQYLRLFERCAIVNDLPWIRESSRFVVGLLPCPVRVFGDRGGNEAVAWAGSGTA